MGRARGQAMVTTSVGVLVATLLGGCGGTGSPGTTTVTVTAAGRSSTVATHDASTGVSPPTEAPRPATTSSTATSPAGATTETPAGPRLRISHRLVPDEEGRPLLLPQLTVTPVTRDASTSRAARVLREALMDQVAEVVDGWEAAAPVGAAPQGTVTTQQVVVPVNEPELVVVAWRAEVYTGGAHGVTVLRSVTVDIGHGELVTDAALLEQLQRAGGPGWVFERELRRAVRTQLPDVPADEVGRLTRKELHLYPTRTGLHVTGDRCVLACAFPPLEVTIPWDRLVGRGDDIRALPDAWGL